MKEKELNANESLELIAKMIQNTQNKLERNGGVPFLVWGYTTILTAVGVWLLLSQTGNPYWNFLWFAIPLIGGSYTAYTIRRNPKGVVTYVDRVIGYIWAVFGAASLVTSLIAMFHAHRFPILFTTLLLMGMGVVLTGLVIRFKPLVFCGVVGALSSVILLFIPHTFQILFFALVFVVMMVIPGHILNYSSRKNSH